MIIIIAYLIHVSQSAAWNNDKYWKCETF